MKIKLCLAAMMVMMASQSVAAESKFDREIALFESWLKVGVGSVLADIGAGNGKFAIALSRAVGETGRVYATELSEDDRLEIEEAAREAGALQVEVIEAQIQGTGLPNRCCDGIFLNGVYHHLTDPVPFARSLFESLRPGGRLAIVDFPPTMWLAPWTPEGIPENRGGHGIARDYGVLFERPALP